MSPQNPVLIHANDIYGVMARLGDDRVIIAIPTLKLPSGSQLDAAIWLFAELLRDANFATLADFKGTSPTSMRYTWIRMDEIWLKRATLLGITKPNTIEMTIVGEEAQEEVALILGRAPKPGLLQITGTKVSQKLRELFPERAIG